MTNQIQVSIDEQDNSDSVVAIDASSYRAVLVSLKYNSNKVADGLIVTFAGYLPEAQLEGNREIPIKVFERLHCSGCIDRATCEYLPDVLYKCWNCVSCELEDEEIEGDILDPVSTGQSR